MKQSINHLILGLITGILIVQTVLVIGTVLLQDHLQLPLLVLSLVEVETLEVEETVEGVEQTIMEIVLNKI